jgi:hypothetical protein
VSSPSVSARERRADIEADLAVEEDRTVAAPQPRSLRSVFETIGVVLAPLGFLTALAYYFGWKRTNELANYFGIEQSELGFSTQDHVLRSVDGLYVVLGAIFTVALTAVWLHAAVSRRLEQRGEHQHLRVASRLLIVAGAILFMLGAIAAVEGLPFDTPYLFDPISPGLGVGLLAYGIYMRERLARGRRSRGRTDQLGWQVAWGITLVALLIALSVFWTASEYAEERGRDVARRLAAVLPGRAEAVVYSRLRLHIDARGVTEEPIGDNRSAYRFRYTGLRLLIKSGGKHFLVPAQWSRSNGVVVVLPDTEATRVEFARGRQ